MEDRRIGTEHLLLGLLRSEDRSTLSLFERLDIQPRAVRELIIAELRKAA